VGPPSVIRSGTDLAGPSRAGAMAVLGAATALEYCLQAVVCVPWLSPGIRHPYRIGPHPPPADLECYCDECCTDHRLAQGQGLWRAEKEGGTLCAAYSKSKFKSDFGLCRGSDIQCNAHETILCYCWPTSLTNPAEVNRKSWSSERCVHSVSHPSLRKMVTFIMVNRTITATTVGVSSSNAVSNTHLGGQAGPHRTLTGRADFLAGYLSCGGSHPQVALRLSRPVF
jgi:hypothetical protein